MQFIQLRKTEYMVRIAYW